MNKLHLSIQIFILLLLLNYQSFGQDSATFSTEIPKEINEQPDIFYELTRRRTEQLNLKNLESGYDSILIRVWVFPSTNHEKVYTIKMDSTGWQGWCDYIEIDWNMETATDSIKKHKMKKLEPRTEWNMAVQSLLDRQIMTLPNMFDIEGIWLNVDPKTGDTTVTMVADGTTFCFEVVTSSSYRLYNYNNPIYYQDFWQAKNVVEIIDILRSEFIEEKKKRKTRTPTNG